MKKFLIIFFVLLLVVCVLLVAGYVVLAPKAIHKVVHGYIEELHKEKFSDNPKDPSTYEHKSNADGSESSIITSKKHSITVTSVAELNIVQSYLNIELKSLEKNEVIKIKVSVIPEFNDQLHILWTFEDVISKVKDGSATIKVLKPEMITSIPFEAFKQKEKPHYIDIITRSKIKFSAREIKTESEDVTKRGHIKEINYTLSFKDSDPDFFMMENIFNIKEIKIPVIEDTKILGFDNVTNLNQTITIESFQRTTLKKIIDMIFNKDKKKNPMGMMGAMGELENLLPKSGAQIKLQGTMTTSGKESFIKLNSKLPMPLMAVMKNGPEVFFEGQVYEGILPLLLKDYMVQGYVDRIIEDYEWVSDPNPFVSSGDEQKDRFAKMMYEMGAKQRKKAEMVTVLSKNAFHKEQIDKIIEQLVVMKLLVKEGEFFKFDASYISKNLVVNSIKLDAGFNQSFEIDPIVDKNEIKKILEENGFKSLAATTKPEEEVLPDKYKKIGITKKQKLKYTQRSVYWYEDSRPIKNEFQNIDA